MSLSLKAIGYYFQISIIVDLRFFSTEYVQYPALDQGLAGLELRLAPHWWASSLMRLEVMERLS